MLSKFLLFRLHYCPKHLTFIMPPFEEEGVYCFANVGRSVCLSVGPSVDQMVSANYLGIHSPQGSHILCGELSWWVGDPYWFFEVNRSRWLYHVTFCYVRDRDYWWHSPDSGNIFIDIVIITGSIFLKQRLTPSLLKNTPSVIQNLHETLLI